jgi:iron complex outermembrane receptor protein
MMSPTRLKIFTTIDKHYQKKSFYLTISTEHTFSQNRVDKNEKKTAGYILLGIETGVSYKKTDLKINIENATNKRYLKHLSTYRQLNIPEPGINFNVMLSYRFSTSLENKENRN